MKEQRPPEGRWAFAWGKSIDDGQEHMPLWRHLDDAAAVAWLLWERWLSPSQRALLAEALDGDEERARRAACFLAAAHDVGKHSIAFAMKVPALRDRMERAGYVFVELSAQEQRQAPHGLVGMHAIRQWLSGAPYGWKRKEASALAAIVGGHHGVFPARPSLRDGGDGLPRAMRVETGEWHEGRMAILERARATAGLEEADLLALRRLDVQTAQLLFTGYLIACDWISSNSDFFPFADAPDGTSLPPLQRAERALRRLALPPVWRPQAPGDVDEHFARRFELPVGAEPRNEQRALVEAARSCTEPSLLVLEAATGSGKTEAALAAAEILAERFGLGGLVVGLPTRATSDAMFSRLLAWLGRTLPEGVRASTVLSHGKAEFNEEYRELMRTSPRAVYDEEGHPRHGDAVAHWWLRGRKTSALADFSVGTIDQILFSALKARHLALRHSGISGRVVLLDEVHAADEYMNVYLHRALEWLGAYGVPVIALSATLPGRSREGLLAAYERGRQRARGERPDVDEPASPALRAAAATEAYPVVLLANGREARAVPVDGSAPARELRVETLGEDEEALARRVLDELADGGCIAVVRNTVARAQQLAARLRERLGEDCVLLHSRFIGMDRRLRERALVERLGPRGERPRRLVVVATQVIEQSLDVDFDLLVSDLAPVDLLVQRAGRLHRHHRPEEARPEGMRTPRLLLSGVDRLDGRPPEFPPGCLAVYGRSALLRAAAVVHGHGPRWRIPEDVPRLVQRAYDERLPAPPGWEEAWTKAEQERIEARHDKELRADAFRIAPPGFDDLFGWAVDSVGEASEEPAGRAQVRDSEDSIEAVVVQRVQGRLCSLPWLPEGHGGRTLDDAFGPDDALARSVAQCALALPGALSRGERGDRLIEALEQDGPASWQQSRWLRGVLPLVLDEELCAVHDGTRIEYHPEIGLVTSRVETAREEHTR